MLACNNPTDETFQAPSLEDLVPFTISASPSTSTQTSTSSALVSSTFRESHGAKSSSPVSVTVTVGSARSTAPPAPGASNPELDNAAKAGIGVGVAVFVLLLALIIWLVCMKRHRATGSSSVQERKNEENTSQTEYLEHKGSLHEARGRGLLAEVSGTGKYELNSARNL